MKKNFLLFFILFASYANCCFAEKAPIVIDTKQIIIPEYPKAFNPSLIKTEKGFLLTFRTLGKKLNISYIGLVCLNDEFELISEPTLLKTRSDKDKISSQSEDARIFSCNGDLYLIYNDNVVLEHPTTSDRRDIFIAKLKVKDSKITIENQTKLIHPDYYLKFKWQKNWVPFEWNNTMLFGYSLNPHEIIAPNFQTGICDVISSTKPLVSWKFGKLRGGTPATLFEGEYLAFFHSAVDTATEASNNVLMPHYFMGAYTFNAEPPFAITKMTQIPILHPSFYTKSDKKLRVIFPGGFVVEGSKIFVAYGKDDEEVWIATIDVEALKIALKPVKIIPTEEEEEEEQF